MQRRIDQWLRRQSEPSLLGLSVLLYLIVEVVTYAVQVDLSLSFFHLLPVMIAAWYVGREASVFISIICCLTWLYVDIATKDYDPSFLPFWNFGIRLSLFVFIGYLISAQRRAYKRESQLARIDGLTGICNRRAFEEILQLEIARSRRYQTSFTLAYLDIDNFKAVNDSLGHGEGDRLLQAVAKQLVVVLRASDVVGRLGGDEFALLLPHTSHIEAHAAIIRGHVHLSRVIAGTWPVGFSIGVVTFREVPNSVSEVISKADKAMYKTKKGEKNRVVFYADNQPVS